MEDDEKRSRQPAEDPFTTMMFGSRNRANTENETQQQQASTIDYEELMVNIDKLVESAKNLKPLFHKFYPLIEQFLKKNT